MDSSEKEKQNHRNIGCLTLFIVACVIGYFIGDDESIKKNWKCSCYGDGSNTMMGSYYHSRVLYNMTQKEANLECSNGGLSRVNCSIFETN